MEIKAIVTIPPYADFIREIADHPLVDGFRLNTVMPIHETQVEVLEKISQYGKPVWVDLKSRQLRVIGAAIPPFTAVELSHNIEVNTPVNAFFSDGNECVRIMSVSGNQIILEDGPKRLIGPGESVNIIDPSLRIEGTLTSTDISYLEAMQTVGINNVMLSYVESADDLQQIKKYLPQAQLILKIETIRGLDFVKKHKNQLGQLMAARGDLYVEVVRPHRIIHALNTIIQADPQAFVASRIFDSLVHNPVPSSADISDAAWLISMGYRNFLFGDLICLRKDTILEGLNLLNAIAGQVL